MTIDKKQLAKTLALENEILKLDIQINQTLTEMLANLETYLEKCENERQKRTSKRHRQNSGQDSIARQNRTP